MLKILTKPLVIILVFLFPIMMGIVVSSVSSIYLLLLIIGTIFYKNIAKRHLNKQEKTVLFGFIAVFAIYLLGMLNSNDIYKGFKVLGKFHYFLFAIPIFVLLRQYKTALIKNFDISLIIAGISILLYLIINPGSTGAYHSIMYGSFAMLIAGINLLLFALTNQNLTTKILLLISGLCAISGSLIVGARGSWLALLVLMGIFLYLLFSQKKLRLKIIIALTAILLTISASVHYFHGKTMIRFDTAMSNIALFFKHEQAQEKQPLTSSGARLIFWKASIDSLKQYPFFGSGSGDFRLELRKFTHQNPQYKAIGDQFGSAHNIFFEWLAVFGVVGFLVLIFTVFLLPLRYFLQIAKNQPDKLWASIIGIWIILSSIVFGLTETWIVRSAPNGVYVFFVLLFMVFSINEKAHTSEKLGKASRVA